MVNPPTGNSPTIFDSNTLELPQDASVTAGALDKTASSLPNKSLADHQITKAPESVAHPENTGKNTLQGFADELYRLFYVVCRPIYSSFFKEEFIRRLFTFQRVDNPLTQRLLGEGQYAQVTQRLIPVSVSSLKETLALTPLEHRDKDLPPIESVHSLGQLRAHKTSKQQFDAIFQHGQSIMEKLPKSPYLIRQTDCNGGIDMERAYTDLQKIGYDQQKCFIGYQHLGLLGCAGILRNMACALRDLHAANLAHRDVKPANTLVTADGVKLCDFDFAVQKTAINAPFAGTSSYMAPESLETVSPNYDFCSSDVWALGVIVAGMILGHRQVKAQIPSKTQQKGQWEVKISVNRAHTMRNKISKVSGLFRLLVPLAQSMLNDKWEVRPKAEDVASQLTAFCQRVTQWTRMADCLHKTLAAYYPLDAATQKCQEIIQEGISSDEIEQKSYDAADYAHHVTVHQTITENCAPYNELESRISESNLSLSAHQKRINFQETCLSIVSKQVVDAQDVFSPLPKNIPMNQDQWQAIVQNLVTPSDPKDTESLLKDDEISVLVDAAIARYEKDYIS